MFITDLVRNARRTVRFRAEGGDPARLLRRLRAAEITLWTLQFFDGGFFAFCDSEDYKRLPPLVRGTGMRVRVVKKQGIAFRLRRFRGRVGIPIGLCLAAVLFFVLCPRVWVVELQSEDIKSPLSPALQTQIGTYLEQNGVFIGAKKSGIPSTEIRLTAPAKIEGVGALSVNLSGCVAHVSVMPREPFEKKRLQAAALSDLVATRDGIVRRCEITSGRRVCLVGEAVVKGTLLATGVVDTEVGPLLRRATGRVLAETTRVLTVTVPFSETVHRPAGRVVRQYTLSAFGLNTPLFTPLPTDGWVRERASRPLKLFGRALPLCATVETAREQTAVTTVRDKQQATVEAKKRLKKAENAALSACEILKKCAQVSTDKRGVTVTATYTVLEDIAKEVPVTVRENP